MAEAKKKPNVFSRIGSFFRSCVGVMKKIRPTMIAIDAGFRNAFLSDIYLTSPVKT